MHITTKTSRSKKVNIQGCWDRQGWEAKILAKYTTAKVSIIYMGIPKNNKMQKKV